VGPGESLVLVCEGTMACGHVVEMKEISLPRHEL